MRVKLSALPPDLQNFPRSLQRPRRRRIQIYYRLLISTSRATSTRVKRGPNLKIKAYKAMYKAAQTAYAITSFFAATSPRLTEAPQPGRLFNPQSYTSSVRSPAGRPTYSFGSKTGPSGVRDSGGYRDISDRRASPEMLHGKATLVAARLAVLLGGTSKIQIAKKSGTHRNMHTLQRRSDEPMAHGLLTLFTHRLLMSLLRETPILDGDRNPRRFIARLPLYSDPSRIN